MSKGPWRRCKNGHEWTPENTRMVRHSTGRMYRRCLICEKEWYRSHVRRYSRAA